MRILYFGTYNSEWGRTRIYMRGLRELSIEVLECQSIKPGIAKYVDLFQKHQKIKNTYDYLVVGYPGHAVVWFAKLLSNKPVIFDAGWTMEEGVLISRKQKGLLGIKGLYIKFIDWVAVKCADLVLVESEEQKKYFENKFGKSAKYKVVYTGAFNSVFFLDNKIKKREKFTVIFRGKFLPEAGVQYVVETAKLLEDSGINFLIVGNGYLENEIKNKIEELKPKNLNLISEHLSDVEIRETMLSCHISLGQLENHERLNRTIPHKCFESLALRLPYVTARTKPIGEILKDGESCVFVNPADSKDLAKKIIYLKNNKEVLNRMGDNGYKIYQNEFTPKKLTSYIISALQKISPQK